MSAARVGLHRAVVWNWLYFSPLSASFWRVGVEHGPPNVLVAPNPTSSSSTSSTFGAPFGAWTGCVKSLFESFARKLMIPWNGWGGAGSTADVPATCDGFALFSWANVSAQWPDAAKKPDNTPIASIAVVLVFDDIDSFPATMGFWMGSGQLGMLARHVSNASHHLVNA